MKKKLLFLMTLTLMGWSNVWGTDSYWHFYLYESDGSANNRNVVFQTTDDDNIFVIKNFSLPKQGIYYRIYKDVSGSWTNQYGYRAFNEVTTSGEVTSTGEVVPMGLETKEDGELFGNAWLNIPVGTYDITFDKSAGTIRFDGWYIVSNRNSWGMTQKFTKTSLSGSTYEFYPLTVEENGITFSIITPGYAKQYVYSSEITDRGTYTFVAKGTGTWENAYSSYIKTGHTYKLIWDESTKELKIEAIIKFDETSESAPTFTEGVYDHFTLNRTFSTTNWQTLCLPVNMTSDQINYYFGSGTQVAEFTGATDNTLTFSTVTTITNNKSYLILPTNTSMVDYAGGTVYAFSPDPTTYGDYNFIGTNHKMTLSSGEYYVADGSIHQQKSQSATIKATRAYFTTPALSARKMSFSIDGVVTSINQIEIPEEENVTGDIYNLNGQRMDKPFESLPAGVYIVSGKKIIKK